MSTIWNIVFFIAKKSNTQKQKQKGWLPLVAIRNTVVTNQRSGKYNWVRMYLPVEKHVSP